MSCHVVVQKMRKLDFNSGNAIQTRRCYNTPLHSGSTQLNYEWRSILREGRRRSRDTSTRKELRGFHGKIKREKNIRRRILSSRTIQKHLSDTLVPRYPTDLSFGMQFSYVTLLPSAKLD